MNFGTVGRASLLALALVFSTSQNVLAHALPGTVLTLSQENDAVQLTVVVNVEDMAIAEPALAALHDLSLGPVDAAPVLHAVAGYFDQHMRLEQHSELLGFKLQSLELRTDSNDHVGEFRVIVLTFEGQSNELRSPLILRYDAVMHEVRNHRAAFYWQPATGDARKMAEFGYRKVDNQTAPVTLVGFGD